MPTAMNSTLRTALGLTLCLIAVNCGATTEPAAVVESGTNDPAVALVEQVARAYQQTPALVDECEITMTSRGRSRTNTNVIWLGPRTDARVSIEGYDMTAVDGQFLIEHVDRPAKYVQLPLDGNLMKSFAAISGGAGLPVPQAALRYGKTYDDYIAAFGLGKAAGLRLQGVETIQRDGKTFEQLTMSNDQGATVRALIDPATKFLNTISLTTPGSEYVLAMAPQRLKGLPDPLVVSTTDRRRVESIRNLMNLSAGDDAPDITLETLDGREVSLADHRGSLVVIDFWATWCGPCRMGLPKLQEFSTWAQGEGLPVKVLPVDMGEKQKTKDLKNAAVSRYWKKAGYTMPTLMDYDNTAARAYQVGSIPHTVIVDPQGKIVKVEIGFNPNAVRELKALTNRTFGG